MAPTEPTIWSRAYVTVRTLACCLIPATTALTAFTLDDTTRDLFRDMKMELPLLTTFFLRIGWQGIVAVGCCALAAIAALAPWREKRIAVVVASAILVLCVLFMFFGLSSAFLPFRVIMAGMG